MVPFSRCLRCQELVPALLAAGGNPVPDEAWQCYTWKNCLVANAFGVKGLSGVPLLYREQAQFLIQVFDAKLLSRELCYPESKAQ